MWATITRPFAWLMLQLYEWTGNYGVALILFALAVNLILTPFMAKSRQPGSSQKFRNCRPDTQGTSKSSTKRCRSFTGKRASTLCPAVSGL